MKVLHQAQSKIIDEVLTEMALQIVVSGNHSAARKTTEKKRF
jgi:hypothetical protein